MITNWFLWHNLKERRLGGKVQNRKQLFIALIFGVSFLYRAIFDTLAGYTPVINDLLRDYPGWWCLVFAGLHLFGEFLPLGIMFIYQLRMSLKIARRQSTLLPSTDQADE
jgi:hypothetical protein